MMKTLILLPIIGFAFFSSSCRTVTPLDPMTLQPAQKCLPENLQQHGDGYSGK